MALKPIPVPSEIVGILEQQRGQLLRVAPQFRTRLLAAALETRRLLEVQLRALSANTFSAQETRVVLAQVNGVVDFLAADYGTRVASIAQQVGAHAAQVGRDSLMLQIDYWARQFRGSVRQVSRAGLAGDVLRDGLLEHYQQSRLTYGSQMMRKMRDVLATSVLSGETVPETSVRLAEAAALPAWKAERIVRTEQSFAMHWRAERDLVDLYGDDAGDEWDKQLIATFDSRTGKDSKFVHGQRRHLSDDFADNEGRRYPRPPNRPNDREVMVFVPRPVVRKLLAA